MEEVKIEIKAAKVGDPEITVYSIVLVSKSGIWRETAGSKADLENIIKGIKMGFGMAGIYPNIPEIPR